MIDLFGLLAVQGIVKHLLQYHNLKTSILQHSAFFMVQLSHPYMTTGKIRALTIWTLVGKLMSLLFIMLSRFGIDFFPRRKCLLILWLQSLSVVMLKPKKMKSITVLTFSSSIYYEVMGPDIIILVLWMLNFKPVFWLSSFTIIKRLYHQKASCHKSDNICISDVVDISPGILDPSLWLNQPRILHDVPCR